MAYAYLPFSAKNAKVRLGPAGTAAGPSGPGGGSAYIYNAKQWTIDPTTSPADVTGFEGSGYGQWVGTIIDGEVSCSGAGWDANNNPYDVATANLWPTSFVAAQYFLSGLSSPYWYFANLLVLSHSNDAERRSAMMESWKGKGTGAFTWPTSTFTPIGPAVVQT